MAGTPRYWTLRGMAPDGAGLQEFRIPNELVEHVQRYGPPYKFYELKLVKEVLELPTVVFEGFTGEDRDGLCYAAVPSGRYTNQGTKKPPLPGKTFAVYIDATAKVFHWQWEDADSEFDGYPKGWKERFRRQSWPKN